MKGKWLNVNLLRNLILKTKFNKTKEGDVVTLSYFALNCFSHGE